MKFDGNKVEEGCEKVGYKKVILERKVDGY